MAKRNLPLGGAVPMEPGERDKRVTIQTVTQGTGATSRMPTEDWSALRTVWMRVLTLKGAERQAAEQTAAMSETQFEMGYAADMDPELVDVPATKRLVYQGRTFDVIRASLIGRREGVELIGIARSKVN